VGWAVHGLIFEYLNGKRQGCLLVDFGDRLSLDLSDKNIERRSGVGWTEIEYGDYIVGMHGDQLKDPNLIWFCHSVTLEFASGRSIRYSSLHEAWKGEPFSYVVPQPCLVYRITFKHEQNQDMLGLVTSMHLPLSRANMTHLPRRQKEAAIDVLTIAKQVDESRASVGQKPLGEDLWWHILGFIRAWELGPPSVAQATFGAPR